MTSDVRLICGDCLSILPTLAAGSVGAVVTDPPYFKIKGEAWDNQWKTPTAFLGWMDCVLQEFARVLKPNGSLYLFASPEMSARVECLTAEHFNVLNRITWQKPPYSTKAEMFRKEDLRQFFPVTESVIFAEQNGTDQHADDASGYTTQCEQTKRGIFGAYLEAEFARAGTTRKQVSALFPSVTGNLTGCVSNWLIGYNVPTPDQYQTMREFLNATGGEYLKREYEYLKREYEYLKREYEDLKREYEDLRRPFDIKPAMPYTDVWTFKTVGTYDGKHPCEKPQAILQHMIKASTRPGDTVLDAFMGTGSCGLACHETGRNFIGIEKDETYFCTAQKRIADAQAQTMLNFEAA